MSVITKLYNLLLYSSVLIAASAVGWCESVYLLTNVNADPLALALVFLLVFLFYNRDRLQDYDKPDDRINQSKRASWIKRHYKTLKILCSLAKIGIVIITLYRPVTLVTLLIGIPFVIAYNAKILPGHRSFKQLPCIKVPYVAGLITLLVVFMPLTVAGYTLVNVSTVWVSIGIFSFNFSAINLNDIRDIEGDRLVGTYSIAVILGEWRAKLISTLFVLVGTVASIFLHSFGWLFVACYLLITSLAYNRKQHTIFSLIISLRGFASLLGLYVFP